MEIEHYKKSTELHIALRGELDVKSCPYARTLIDGLIDGGGIKSLYVDMSGLDFMDSTGVGVLIGRYKKLKPLGIPIYIQSPSAAVDRVLRLSGMYSIMTKAG